MIASLRGRLRSREPVAVLEIAGFGLAVQVSARTAAQLPALGEEVSLLTYLHVREDHLSLYGFTDDAERQMFLSLLGISGIGPRVALTLLSSAPLAEFKRALLEADEKYLVRLPGLGKKTAARLVVELQGKIGEAAGSPAGARVEAEPAFDEAILALASLGLSQRAARDAIEKIDRERLPQPLRVEDIVKTALKSGVKV